MSNNQGIPVTLFEHHVRVPNGMGSSKNISMRDFIMELERAARGEEQREEPLRAFRLPNEAVSFAINQNELRILMYFPERIHGLQHENSRRQVTTYQCPVPPTVIYVRLSHNPGNNRWVVEDTKWLCTDYLEDEVPSVEEWGMNRDHNRHLWALPFPNQYGDGRMCVGANSYRTLYDTDLRGLNELYFHVLLSSPFNNDLGTRTKESWDPAQLFNYLNNKEKFPFEILPGHPGRVTTQPVVEEDDEDEDNDWDEEDDNDE